MRANLFLEHYSSLKLAYLKRAKAEINATDKIVPKTIIHAKSHFLTKPVWDTSFNTLVVNIAYNTEEGEMHLQ